MVTDLVINSIGRELYRRRIEHDNVRFSCEIPELKEAAAKKARVSPDSVCVCLESYEVPVCLN